MFAIKISSPALFILLKASGFYIKFSKKKDDVFLKKFLRHNI